MIKNTQWHRYKSWQDGVTFTNSTNSIKKKDNPN